MSPDIVAVSESPPFNFSVSFLRSSVSTVLALSEILTVCDRPAISVSTYALIDCCVASAVALSDDMSSSSLMDVTFTVPSPLNANDELNFVAEPIVIKLESPALI